MMRSFPAFLLSLALALTSISMAVARGQGQPGAAGAGEIVICTGVGITTIIIGPDGEAEERIHMCPDAMMQMLALFTPPPRPAARASRISRMTIAPGSTRLSRTALSPSARDPPQSA